jgi:hypothetical protein
MATGRIVGRSRLGPGTHVAENSVAVKRFDQRNLGPVPRFRDEFRITTLAMAEIGRGSLTLCTAQMRSKPVPTALECTGTDCQVGIVSRSSR